MTFWWAQEWKQPSRLPIFGCCSKSWTLFDRGRTLAPKSEETWKLAITHSSKNDGWSKWGFLASLYWTSIWLPRLPRIETIQCDRHPNVTIHSFQHQQHLLEIELELAISVQVIVEKVLKIRGDSELQLKLYKCFEVIWFDQRLHHSECLFQLRVAEKLLGFFLLKPFPNAPWVWKMYLHLP